MSKLFQCIVRQKLNTSPSTDINILMLGETGVGKSTFINAFANYLLYNTLNDAKKGEIQVIIPSVFYMEDPNTCEETKIMIGNPDDNETCGNVGQSCTQVCQSYIFPIGNRLIRFIDGPGIGDVRGIEQDAKNCDHILRYIKHLQHLNGICILLKPNCERLNIGFRFCIKEILRHLHISARNNLIFVFTNARSTLYRLGSTNRLIRTVLNELHENLQVEIPFNRENTFLFDNESFRFIAAYKHGIQFSENEEESYGKSWDQSVQQLKLFTQCIVRYDLHAVRDSISINSAQQLIRSLSRPIAEISRLIQENIDLAKQCQLNATTNSPEKILQKIGKMKKFHYPRTVCTTEKCIEIIRVDNEQKINYKTICHSQCYLKDVERECVGHPILNYCTAIDQLTDMCNVCNCHWKTHMHISYEYETFITSKKVESILKHITQLKDEEAIIIQVCNELAKFIQKNSIIPYNDDILEYIRYFIREEEMKKAAGAQNENVIQGLKNMIEQHEGEQNFYRESLKNQTASTNSSVTNNKIEPEDIFDLVDKLYALPINGESIKEQIEGIKQIQLQVSENKEHFIELPVDVRSTSTINEIQAIITKS